MVETHILRGICVASILVAASTPVHGRADVPADNRTKLAEKGVKFDAYWTNFYMGAVRGSSPQGMEGGGRFDLYLNFDGEKLMNWKGGGIAAKLEYRYGEPGTSGGAILPNNLGMLTPVGFRDRPVLTSLHLTQKTKSGFFLLGRINAVDLLKDSPMLGGRGIDGFSHLEFAATLSGLTPIVVLGGVAILPAPGVNWTLMAYDPNDQTNISGVANAFGDGVNLVASASLPLKLTAHPNGSHSFGFKYGTKEATNLGEIGLPGKVPGTKRGSWVASYSIEQYLAPTWGFFGMVQVADGNPNILQDSYKLGIGGKGLFSGRPQDRFGLGYFNTNFSEALQDAISSLVETRQEEGIEFFYNYELKRNLNLVGNVQWLRPADASKRDATVLGLRVVFRF